MNLKFNEKVLAGVAVLLFVTVLENIGVFVHPYGLLGAGIAITLFFWNHKMIFLCNRQVYWE